MYDRSVCLTVPPDRRMRCGASSIRRRNAHSGAFRHVQAFPSRNTLRAMPCRVVSFRVATIT
ncbi:hypothetical protein C7S13_7996 [Burkholderia cepacia]|nr:hypothetical protein [Burkholderia cepacia]